MTDVFSQLQSLPRPLAFVFSGGSSLGSIQVGMVRALFEAGFEPDLLVGTSVGALNAAFLGAGLSSSRLDALEALWRGMRTQDVFGSGLRAIMQVARRRAHLVDPRGLQRLVKRHIAATHAELSVPTAVVAADADTGQPVVLREGDLRTHVMASAAIPGVFPAVVQDERQLVDGGVAANVPLVQAEALGARTLVVLDAGYPCHVAAPRSGLVGTWLHHLGLILSRQALVALPFLADRVVVLYLPAPCPVRVLAHDFTHSESLIEAGYASARGFLEEVSVDGNGCYGHPHIHEPGPS